MKQIIYSLLLILLVSIAPSLYAQETDEPLVADINYDMTVQETLTDHAFFDWWRIDVELGDKLVVSMEARGGLQPLLGLLDENSELVTRSDLESVAEVDGIAFLQHTTLTAGQYTIIASRDGRDQGTTTGTYLLTATNGNNIEQTRANPFLETEFRCSEWLLTNAFTFKFSDDIISDIISSETDTAGQLDESYRISVYGLDGFEPVIRILANFLPDRPLDCADSSQGVEGSSLSLPFLDAPYIVTSDDNDNVAMITVNNSSEEPLGDIAVSIGAKDGSSGRFIVIVEGMELHDRMDVDEFLVRRGAFARDTELDVYMIGYPNNRLDSLIEAVDEETDTYRVCDDIGRDDCADFPPITGATITISENSYDYIADRFDAGLRIDSPDNNSIKVSFRSREFNTAGLYLVMFVGELPPRD